MTRVRLGDLKWGASFCALAFVTLSAAPALADDGGGGPLSKLELGVFGGVHIPSDTNELGVDDDATDTLGTSFGLGARLGFAITDMVSAEAEGALGFGKTADTDTSTTIVLWRAHALVHALPSSKKVRPFGLIGAGGISNPSENDALTSDTDLAFHLGAGAKFKVHDRVSLRLDGRVVFPPSSSGDGATVSFEVWAGIAVPLGSVLTIVKDRDGDGIADGDDKCPDEPENMNGVEDSDGCPENEDPDGDGIAGAADKCPNKAEDKDSFQDDDGCPDEDNDGDGIPDTGDKCPDEEETKNGIDDADGCPERDEDNDGLIGSKDKCPADPEDMDGFEDDDGCPDTDNDKDGVVDSDDGCPAKPGPVENRGCPDTDRDGDTVVDRLDNCPDVAGSPKNFGCKQKQLVKIVGSSLKILDKVYFKKNRSRVRAKSRRLLNNVARVINAQKGIAKIRVEGHTDNQGDAAFNKELSQKRAQAVVDWLVKKGVAAERLEAVGYGMEKPVDTNDTKEGRANNRRVEFKIISDSPAPATQPSAPSGDGTGSPDFGN